MNNPGERGRMPHSAFVEAVSSLATNVLDPAVGQSTWVTGLLGDHPSHYSRSPALWNRAFGELGLDARYAAFDVPADRVDRFVQALRDAPNVLGLNVTVPYKQTLLPLLDDLDPMARSIGATNCVIRQPDGRLIGSNTDAEGALACLVRERPGASPFFPELAGTSVLLVGAGGAGRAVASALLPRLGETGCLYLANRTPATAHEVARAVDSSARLIRVIEERALAEVAPELDLVINASTRGQAGFFPAGEGRVTCLEPYSPLGPAEAPAVRVDSHADSRETWRSWYIMSLDDVRANERAAADVMARMNPRASFFDLVYAPAETTFLRTARWAGHATLNGADMILHQAVAGFLLIAARLLPGEVADSRARVEAAMRAA